MKHLYDFAREVADVMRAYPTEVRYGGRRWDQHTYVLANSVQIEQLGPEVWRSPVVTQSGPLPTIATRAVAIRIRVEGRSERAGAQDQDHVEVCEVLLRALWRALRVAAARCGTPILEPAAGGYIEPLDDQGIGARYELRLQIEASVAVPEAALGPALSGDGVVLVSAQPDEIVCGE